MVTSANDNATYHLAELDRTRMTVPIARKWVKVFKKRHWAEWIRRWRTKTPTKSRSKIRLVAVQGRTSEGRSEIL